MMAIAPNNDTGISRQIIKVELNERIKISTINAANNVPSTKCSFSDSTIWLIKIESLVEMSSDKPGGKLGRMSYSKRRSTSLIISSVLVLATFTIPIPTVGLPL